MRSVPIALARPLVVLIAGAFVAAAVAAPGEPDPSFGDGGTLLVPLDRSQRTSDMGRDLVLQRGGKIVVGAELETKSPKFVLARLTADGQLDRRFGRRGIVGRQIGPRGASAYAMAEMRGGGFVMVGTTRGGEEGGSNAAVAVFRRSGRIDRRFSDDGKLIFDVRGTTSAYEVAVSRDGLIAVGGSARNGLVNPLKSFVAVLDDRGRFVRRFGGDGVVVDPRASGSGGLVFQPDGRLVMAASLAGGRRAGFGALRYLPSGEVDRRFGRRGIVKVPFRGDGNDVALGIVLDGRGRIVLGGTARRYKSNAAMAVARLRGNGRRDRSFSDDGKREIAFDGPGSRTETMATSVVLDGRRIVLAGRTEFGQRDLYAFAVARLLGDGRLDPRFGDGGRTSLEIPGNGDDFASAVVVDGRRRPVIAGESSTYRYGNTVSLARVTAR